MKTSLKLTLAGAVTGAVNGLLGAGGGMVLVPLLERSGALEEDQLFTASLAVMTPLCLVSLLLSGGPVPFMDALPFLPGSFLGGLVSAKLRIRPLWLHRILGVLIFMGGIRLLWN